MENKKDVDSYEELKEENNSNSNEDDIDKKNDEDSSSSHDANTSSDIEKIKEENDEEDKLQDELVSIREEKLRILAEMENLRKRIEREKIESIKFGSINLAREILSPGDNLERALAAIPENENFSQSIKNLVEGLKMVQKEFTTILEKNGVKKIDCLNKKFDHNYHQAVMEIEKEGVAEGTVVQEIQTGYTMHDRLLRPAMVGVSKKINSEETKENSDGKNKDMTENKENIK